MAHQANEWQDPCYDGMYAQDDDEPTDYGYDDRFVPVAPTSERDKARVAEWNADRERQRAEEDEAFAE